jgi:hypothetical protein
MAELSIGQVVRGRLALSDDVLTGRIKYFSERFAFLLVEGRDTLAPCPLAEVTPIDPPNNKEHP